MLSFLALFTASLSAQTVNVPFSTNAAGKKLPINWGMDTAWDDLYNVSWGVEHYGTNFTTGRISFQPYELVDASKIDSKADNFGLPQKMARKLQQRINRIKLTGTTKVAINCDHEALVKGMDDNGNLIGEFDSDKTGYNNYVTTNNSTNTSRWLALIKATVKYTQAQGLEVVSVAPFNESDYGWNQYRGNENNGMARFNEIAQAIKNDAFFKTGEGKNIRVCGGNTLNCDRALPWYNSLRNNIDEGNTHQLAGSFENYADFFTQVRQDGKVATGDELHNVGEAIVGAEYGMQNGIWWGVDAKARGEFMHDSNEGVRIGYAEDRSHWTSAAVYRNDKSNQIHGFIGSSERQANASTYNFQCTDREVYFNGYGPQKEWSVTTVGGAAGSYQNGQINYERFFDITYGEDVQSSPIDGNYQIMSAADMKLITSNAYGNDVTANAQANNTSQRWHIYPDNVKNISDCSYWFIDLQSDGNQHLNLRNGNMNAGSKVLTYNANHDALEQWYFRYAKDGYFYIITRRTNKYLYNNNGVISVENAPNASLSDTQLKHYLWRLMPTNATAEQTAPAAPTGLEASDVKTNSVQINWSAVSEGNVTYNILRQDANGWNTIVRCQSGTSFTDTKVESGRAYNYKVQTVDYSGNRSEASEAISVVIPGGQNTSDYTAGQWEWTGETAAAGSWYIYNKANNVFLKKTSAVDSNPSNATLFTLSGTSNATISYSDNGTKYVYESAGTQSWGTTNTNKWTILNQTGGYYIYHRDPGYGWGTRNRYISLSNTAVSYAYQNFTNANRLLQFISENQITKYALMSDYTSAFNGAAGYLSKDISSELKTELEEVLDDCDGTINYQNIEGYIKRLNTISEECQNYLDQHPTSNDDFTGLIINPTIIQNGTVTDLPTGWNASKHQTDNDHYTQDTGNTRLEAWSYPNDLDVDYYQTILLPNGLYTLAADTHQDGDGNACLYGETYDLRPFETKMPVGLGIEHEANTEVQNILVTDGTLRIGIKINDTYNWITADNFTLTRVSTPEETSLSYYTDAVAYLNELAEAQMVRNIDKTELLAARKAANYCDENVAAYEKAINDYAAAIKHAQAMEETEPEFSGTWIGQSGIYINTFAERYNGDTPYPTGRILYQVADGLVPSATYEIEFSAAANVARNLATSNAGDGIAYIFANDEKQDIPVVYQDACTPLVYKLTATADAEGKIAYGIANKKTGGQWYVAQSRSIKLLGTPYTANLTVQASKFGTFVAPFDVVLPEGITAYSAKDSERSIQLTQIHESGETLQAYTPVILKNNTDEPITEDFTKSDFTPEHIYATAGPLTGVLISGDFVPVGDFVLQTQQELQAFYIVVKEKPFTCAQNRCYLISGTFTDGDEKQQVKQFVIVTDDETAIKDVRDNVNGEKPLVIYDLSGRKVSVESAKNGIYIINGKKYIR